MPVYSFICDCGQRSDSFFPIDLPAHARVLHCPNCNAIMSRDYQTENVGIGGDLPSRWNHYDPALDMQITSKSQRDREMKARGLTEYEPDRELKSIRREMMYAKRNAGSKERKEVYEYASKLKREAGRKRRTRIVADELSKFKP